jgi:hypothetical protein
MPTYSYRRDLKASDWKKVIGIGAGAGVGVALVAGYLARIVLQRAPLRPPPGGAAPVLPAPDRPPPRR